MNCQPWHWEVSEDSRPPAALFGKVTPVQETTPPSETYSNCGVGNELQAGLWLSDESVLSFMLSLVAQQLSSLQATDMFTFVCVIGYIG